MNKLNRYDSVIVRGEECSKWVWCKHCLYGANVMESRFSQRWYRWYCLCPKFQKPAPNRAGNDHMQDIYCRDQNKNNDCPEWKKGKALQVATYDDFAVLKQKAMMQREE